MMATIIELSGDSLTVVHRCVFITHNNVESNNLYVEIYFRRKLQLVLFNKVVQRCYHTIA